MNEITNLRYETRFFYLHFMFYNFTDGNHRGAVGTLARESWALTWVTPPLGLCTGVRGRTQGEGVGYPQ